MHYRKVRCCGCGLVYAKPQATEEALPHFYSNDYTQDGKQALESYIKAVKAAEQNCIDHFRKINQALGPGRFLNVGCGVGHMVKVAIETGWDGYGVELSGPFCDYAQDVQGLTNITQEDLFHSVFPKDYSVYMWNAIKHVPDVGELLADVK